MNSAPRALVATADTKLRDARATKKKLSRAALASFSTQGYAATLTRHIETKAGVKRGLINYHFGSKQALWTAAAEHMMCITEEDLGIALKNILQIAPESRLHFLAHADTKFCSLNSEINRLMIQESMNCDRRLNWLLERSLQRWHQQVCKNFDEARALSVAPDMSAHYLHYILTGAATFMFSNAAEVQALSEPNFLDVAGVEAHAKAVAK